MMILEDRIGATAVITLNYPERRNALAVPMRAELVAALERIEADAGVRAVVVTGANGTFSAGGDISGMNVQDLAAGRERFRLTQRLVRLIIEGSKPFIAAVEGWAVGAGLGVALCCDTIVSSDSARFMAGFGKIGLIADFGLLHTLPRRVGEGRARQILMYAEPMDAAAAERIGLIDHVVPAGTALDAALERAAMFADAAPLPIAMTKSWLAQGLADSLEWERNTQSALFLTADHAEGKEAFLAKRRPSFSGV
ncbi:enoyl-CoA hydratase/isomerase family protein [Limobrevibacterium gyesilva]|uniref:Enoyl-CoA hydratase-related protein n=1 Tax=Limobrevibacterium gyesilva TaxID=2991712 RepID=A0AA41YMM9_9PROT|nr:enoyl-CoA hydratase-related protein [Limobrevibacterium gyesilva]MCW3473080.1 enoyl-CoA hydratase-related protein [Limobrevibacterium gyesilva]